MAVQPSLSHPSSETEVVWHTSSCTERVRLLSLESKMIEVSASLLKAWRINQKTLNINVKDFKISPKALSA